MAMQRKAMHKAIVGLPQALSHEHRVGVLADRVAMHIESLVPRGRARCLDVGSGDMTIADAVSTRAPRTDWQCVDVQGATAQRRSDRRGSEHLENVNLPYGDRDFDIAVLCDVLHRSRENAAKLLAEAGRVAQRVLVKDRFEYGPCSRAMLRLMDVVDQARADNVARAYFTREEFTRLAAGERFVITALDCDLSLYEHLPVPRSLLRPDCHFIAVLRRT
jgi:rhodanese-related sulfurtransferase